MGSRPFEAEVGCHSPVDCGDVGEVGADFFQVFVCLLDRVRSPGFDAVKVVGVRGGHHLPPALFCPCPEPFGPCAELELCMPSISESKPGVLERRLPMRFIPSGDT